MDMVSLCLIGNSRYLLASLLELEEERRHAVGVEGPTGNHFDCPIVGSRELSFGEELARSGDPWRFSPLQLRTIWKVGTKVNVDLFASLVEGYDVVEADWVLRGFREGFPIGIPEQGPFPPERIWADSSVPDESKVVIEDFFDTERKAGRIYGPFIAPHGKHWQGVCSYPVSVIPKRPVDGGLSAIFLLVVLLFPRMVLFRRQLGVQNTPPF